MRSAILSIALVSLCARGASAQSINLAIGPGIQPSSSYAAAGLAGFWNALPCAHNTTTFNLKNIAGVTTNVRVWQYGGTELRSVNDPLTTGDHARLMDHCLVTYTPSLETCLFFYDLALGDYEVLTYAMMPSQPTVMSYTSSDEEPGYPHFTIGGAWPGSHVQGITYSRHMSRVTAANGLLRVHSGIVPGQPAASGAACNGIQIRQLPLKKLGDLNCDNLVNGDDVDAFVQAVTQPQSYYAHFTSCRIDNADMNNSGSVTIADVAPFVTKLLNP